MLTLFVRGLPHNTTEQSLTELFSNYGKVFDLKLSRDLFTGKSRGVATVDMEGHHARAAIANLDGSDWQGQTIYVNLDKGKREGRGRR